MIRIHYEEKMQKINQDIYKMGILVNQALRSSVEVLKKMDYSTIDTIVKNDEEVNKLEIAIEDECIMLIATEQPVASDLRRIVSALKTVTQLERMGDHCVHIAKAVRSINRDSNIKEIRDNLVGMADKCWEDLDLLMKAYLDEDKEKAYTIAKKDIEIDQMHNKTITMVKQIMQNRQLENDESIALLFISRFLERFGDHILNICEWLIYNKTGKHVEF
ncbi:MAG: phosphate signaling complex protein PhoU [Spirochaetales bacterium]|nr:phosphate signaling complex protein PhoU [Spirochaetales bacterium]